MLNSARSKCVPLCFEEDNCDAILQDTFVTAQDKVETTARWIDWINGASELQTCCICGVTGSAKIDGFVEKTMAAMKFYKLGTESRDNPYVSLGQEISNETDTAR